MTTTLFLTHDEVYALTGFKVRKKQIVQLRTMGIRFWVNGRNAPVVPRSAIEGASVQETPKNWSLSFR